MAVTWLWPAFTNGLSWSGVGAGFWEQYFLPDRRGHKKKFPFLVLPPGHPRATAAMSVGKANKTMESPASSARLPLNQPQHGPTRGLVSSHISPRLIETLPDRQLPAAEGTLTAAQLLPLAAASHWTSPSALYPLAGQLSLQHKSLTCKKHGSEGAPQQKWKFSFSALTR